VLAEIPELQFMEAPALRGQVLLFLVLHLLAVDLEEGQILGPHMVDQVAQAAAGAARDLAAAAQEYQGREGMAAIVAQTAALVAGARVTPEVAEMVGVVYLAPLTAHP
jgi:hypothetical protein